MDPSNAGDQVHHNYNASLMWHHQAKKVCVCVVVKGGGGGGGGGEWAGPLCPPPPPLAPMYPPMLTGNKPITVCYMYECLWGVLVDVSKLHCTISVEYAGWLFVPSQHFSDSSRVLQHSLNTVNFTESDRSPNWYQQWSKGGENIPSLHSYAYDQLANKKWSRSHFS